METRGTTDLTMTSVSATSTHCSPQEPSGRLAGSFHNLQSRGSQQRGTLTSLSSSSAQQRAAQEPTPPPPPPPQQRFRSNPFEKEDLAYPVLSTEESRRQRQAEEARR